MKHEVCGLKLAGPFGRDGFYTRTDLSVRDWSLRIRYTCGTLQCSQNRARAMGHLKYMIILLDPKNAKIGFHSRLRKIKFQLTFLIRVSRTLSQNGICV